MSEPENLVLQQLREIRAMQDEESARVTGLFTALNQTMHEVQTRLTGIERLVITIVGMLTDTDQRMARLEARVERLEKRFE